MQIMSLTLSGFGSYHGEVALDLSSVDVCAVTGSNGAGKSTLFDAVIWALYGQVPGRTAAEIVNTRGGPARVELVVNVKGNVHTFIRERPAGTKSGSAIYRNAAGEISGSKPVTAQAEELLNASHDVLALTAMSRQGDSGRFGAMDPSQRRRSLSEAVLAGFFEEPREQASAIHARNLEKLTRCNAELEAAESQASGLQQAEQDAQSALLEAEEAEEAHIAAQQEHTNAASLLERLRAAETAAETAKRHDQAAKRARQAASLCEKEAEQAEEKALMLSDKIDDAVDDQEFAEEEAEQEATKANEARAVAAEASGAAREASERLEQLQQSDEGECWVCGSLLTEEHRESLIEELTTLIATAAKTADQAREAQKTSRHAAQTAEQKTQHTAQLQRTQTQLEHAAATKHQSAQNELAAEKAAIRERDLALQQASMLQELRAEAATAPDPQILRRARQRESDAQRELGAAQQRLQACQTAADSLDGLAEQASQAQDAVDGTTLLKRSLAPTGLPHLALEQAMSGLTSAVNEALEDLGPIRLRFVLDDPTKSNPPLKIEALDTSAWNEWRSYGTFSGGERMAMDIALRYGLTRLMGVNCRTVVLDEGWGALDENSSQSLARLLLQLREARKVDAIYTISHVASAVDAFPHRIEVSRGAQGSIAKVLHAA